jgi:hypothetical protein
MGIWHSRQTTSLRGNRFYRRPEREEDRPINTALNAKSICTVCTKIAPRFLCNGIEKHHSAFNRIWRGLQAVEDKRMNFQDIC